jgi:hypothetical protein
VATKKGKQRRENSTNRGIQEDKQGNGQNTIAAAKGNARAKDDFHSSPPWRGASFHRNGEPMRCRVPSLGEYDQRDGIASGLYLPDAPPRSNVDQWSPLEVIGGL